MKTILEIVKEYFPNATEEDVDHYVWNYTGFPCFFAGDPEECFRKQLQEAKNGLEQGKIFDLEYGWINAK